MIDAELESHMLALPAVLRDHVMMLRERVFESAGHLPQFDLLINDLLDLRNMFCSGNTIVSLERMKLYGKNLFAPLFATANFISCDVSPSSAESRGTYNSRLVDDDRFVTSRYESLTCPPENLDLENSTADLIIIPNVVHHVRNQWEMWTEVARVAKPGSLLYVFEPTLREVHQYPDDYVRYTPNGLAEVLRDHGFTIDTIRTTGGPFSAIAYCWKQALQYVTPSEREYWTDWFTEHFKVLMRLETLNNVNLDREFTSFPTAFSVLARRQ